MRGLLSDVRFSTRLVQRQPLLAVVALLSLGVGLGLNVVLFTLANAVLYRPLPVRNPDSLALLGMQRKANVAMNFPYGAYQTFAARNDVFETLVAYTSRRAALRVGGETISANGELVSGTYFQLGMPLAAGRGLTPHDDRADAPPAAVISSAVWNQRFGGGSLSGQTVHINGTVFSIVGVADESFAGMFPGLRTDFWIPLAHSTIVNGRDLLTARNTSWLFVLGRLQPGVTAAAARDALNPVLAAMMTAAGAAPEPLVVTSGRRGTDNMAARLERPLRLLMVAAAVVLLVACINVANLQLARNAARRRELAVRAALGASRARLTRLLMIDAVLIVLPACAISIAVAWAARQPAVGFITRFGQPAQVAVPIDGRVLLFAMAAAAVAAALVGLLAAWQSGRPSALALADGGRADTGTRQRVQGALVVVQFALSMTLLVSAALLVRSVSNLRNTDLGFTSDVVMIEVAPGNARIQGPAVLHYIEQALARAIAVPGVESAAAAHVLPLDFGGSRMTLGIPGYAPQPGEDMEINYLRVTPGYFETMEIPVLRGRAFDRSDAPGSPVRVVVNDTMAGRFWAGRDPVGQPVSVFSDKAPDGIVVGVVADAHYRMVREERAPSFYLAFAQSPFPQAVIHARTTGDPGPLVETLRRAVSGVNPAVPVSRASSLDEQMLRNIAEERMAQAIAVTLGTSAALLAAAGLYGTMSFGVRRRTREIGVRLALGATAGDVRQLVLRQGLGLVIVGAAGGAAGSIVAGRTLASQLYGVSPTDVVSIVAALLLLLATALLAIWLPMRRATRIQPVVALRD